MISYLETRPYREVATGIEALKSLQEFDPRQIFNAEASEGDVGNSPQ